MLHWRVYVHSFGWKRANPDRQSAPHCEVDDKTRPIVYNLMFDNASGIQLYTEIAYSVSVSRVEEGGKCTIVSKGATRLLVYRLEDV